MADYVADPIASVAEQMDNFFIDEDSPRKGKKRKSSSSHEEVDTGEAKTTKKEPWEAELHARQNYAEKTVVKDNEDGLLCKIIEFCSDIPATKLALVSKTFCAATYSVFRRSIPKDAFIRMWKVPKFGTNLDAITAFSDEMHYHSSFLDDQNLEGYMSRESLSNYRLSKIIKMGFDYEDPNSEFSKRMSNRSRINEEKRLKNPPVPEIQAILTFATDSEYSDEIINSMRLPRIAVLGRSENVSFITGKPSQDEQMTTEKDLCIASLFIPECDHYTLNAFSIPVKFTKEDLPRAVYGCPVKPDRATSPRPLKAIFIMQYGKYPLFSESSFALHNGIMVNGGVMAVSSVLGPDKNWAVGLSIFADVHTTVRLYGINSKENNSHIYAKMKQDFKGKSKGFAIFLWNSPSAYETPKRCDVSWEVEEPDELIIYEEDSPEGLHPRELLKMFKSVFPDFPLIGGHSPHITLNNGYRTSSLVTATFLVVAY